MAKDQFETTQVNKMNVHILSTDKFKTTSIVVYVAQNLTEDFVTKNALLPFVLKRGSKMYPSLNSIRQRLDDLYGTIFDADVVKRGEKHVLKFRLDIANEKYLSDPTPLLQEGVKFLGEVLTKPLLENGGFKASIVESEKELVRKRIEGIIDDKMSYAAERCITEMCKEEPYRYFTYGRAEDLETLGADELHRYYEEVFSNNPIDIFVVGDVNKDEMISWLEEEIKFNRDEIMKLEPTLVEKKVNKVNKVVEQLEVSQGKLNMGLRTQMGIADDRYPALLLYNAILGGYPHSKLFVNVREKESLAYYASSRLDGHKGIMTIQSGIQIENYDKAVDIIQQQLEAMAKGEISNEEMQKTKATLSNQLREIKDRSYDLIDFAYHAIIGQYNRPIESLLKAIDETTKEDIVKVAQDVQLDTIYFLRDKGDVK